MLSTNAATALTEEAAVIDGLHLRDLLEDAVRSRDLVLELDDLRVDLSRHKVRAKTIDLLLALAAETGLAGKMEALFSGEPVNRSEGRAVVHMAQRAAARIEGDGYAALAAFADNVRDSDISDVINIGIGGSDLGPAMVSAALASQADGPRIHYVSNVDPAHLHDVLADCVPAGTRVIVTSKTFTTAETKRKAANTADAPKSSECHMRPNTDYDGFAVKWGRANLQDSWEACCKSCQDYVPEGDGYPCNVWVYCPEEGGCFAPAAGDFVHKQCWLKWQEEPENPHVNMRGEYSEEYRATHPTAPERVQWIAGSVVPHGTEVSNGTWSSRSHWK